MRHRPEAFRLHPSIDLRCVRSSEFTLQVELLKNNIRNFQVYQHFPYGHVSGPTVEDWSVGAAQI